MICNKLPSWHGYTSFSELALHRSQKNIFTKFSFAKGQNLLTNPTNDIQLSQEKHFM